MSVSTRDRVLAAAGRLILEGREPTAPAVADALGLDRRTVASPLKRLRAAGLVPRNRTRGRRPRASAPAPAPAPALAPAVHVWPEGRPEEWEPTVACLYYRREFLARRRRADRGTDRP